LTINNLDILTRERENKKKQISNIIQVMKEYNQFDFENVQQELRGLSEKFSSENITISIVAEVSSGKSTFLNALIFKDAILESKVGETTAKLFHITYGDEFSLDGKKVSDIQALKKEISKQNSENLKKIEGKLTLAQIESNISLPDENLKKGVELYDTPGFGTVNEETMQVLLKEAITKSDAVILLLDISQGLKKNEKKFVKDFLDNIVPNKRFIVLNKYDGIIDEDDLILKDKEEIEEEIKSVISQVESNLQELQSDKTQPLETFYLSAKKALVGKKTEKKEVLKESRFEYFENSFWKRIVEAKEEVFDDNVNYLNKHITVLLSLIDERAQGFQKDLDFLKNLLNRSDKIEEVLVNIVKQKETIVHINKVLLPEIKDQIKVNDDKLSQDIKKSLYTHLTPYFENISFWNKLAFWSIKNQYQEAVQKGLSDAENDLNQNMQKFLKSNLEILKAKETYVNNIVENISQEFDKIKKLDDTLVIQPIEKIDFGFKIEGDNLIIDKDKNLDYNITYLLKDLGLTTTAGGISFAVFEFGLARVLPLVAGPIGWIISAILALITFNKTTQKHDEILNKIIVEVVPNIEKALSVQIESIKDFIKISSNKLTNHLNILNDRIAVIESSLTEKEEHEKQVQEIEKKIALINEYINKLENVTK
jgi:signal recognition particle receptor subunit beta/uncharacterized protein YaaW (UPF0174 family)